MSKNELEVAVAIEASNFTKKESQFGDVKKSFEKFKVGKSKSLGTKNEQYFDWPTCHFTFMCAYCAMK